jgi:hypothetical protein
MAELENEMAFLKIIHSKFGHDCWLPGITRDIDAGTVWECETCSRQWLVFYNTTQKEPVNPRQYLSWRELEEHEKIHESSQA